MKNEILKNIENPTELERLFRKNKSSFTDNFNLIFEEIKQFPAAQIWNERLNFKEEKIWLNKKELLTILFFIFLAGFIAKIPDFTGIDQEIFYSRNIGLIIFPFLTFYYFIKQNLPVQKLWFPISSFIVLSLYMNTLPPDVNNDSFVLANLHFPIFLWTVWGYTYIGVPFDNYTKKIGFLKLNGDLLVMSVILGLTGILFVSITAGLFSLIDISLEYFITHYLIYWGLPAIPLIGIYLVENVPQVVQKISPVIARIFTPLVFLTLLVFLGAIIFSGKNPYSDRDFLLLFNIVLIAVLALIIFSLGEISNAQPSKATLLILFALSVLTIIENGIALSAITFRLAEYGLTPNRIAVLGANILIITNLILVSIKLFGVIKGKLKSEDIEKSIASYLPIYSIWALIVILAFPLIEIFI
jgi:hypothetical protein